MFNSNNQTPTKTEEEEKKQQQKIFFGANEDATKVHHCREEKESCTLHAVNWNKSNVINRRTR